MDPRPQNISETKTETSTYASSAARELAYSKGNQAKQQQWLLKTQHVINTFLDKLKQNQFSSFNEVASWVGQQRCLIAIELGHGEFVNGEDSERHFTQLKDSIIATVAEDPKWYEIPEFRHKGELDGPLLYGKLRGFTNQVLSQIEVVLEGDNIWIPLRQQHTLFKALEKLAQGPYGENNSFSIGPFTCTRKDETRYEMSVAFPEIAGSDIFPHSAEIIKIKLKISAEGKKVKFIHPNVSPEEQLGNLKVLDGYWQVLKNWENKQDINIFFENMAKLCHLSACLPFSERGTSSEVEWIIRAISFSKGIYLGPFTAGMGWDFKAFYTPNVDFYSGWLRNAFKSMIFFDVNLPENAVFSYSTPPKSSHIPEAKDDISETILSVQLTDERIAEETSPDFLALLHYSAQGKVDEVRKLLQKNPNLIRHRTSDKKLTSLSIAAEYGKVEVVKFLMESAWDAEDTVCALHAAILSDNAVIFDLLFNSLSIKPDTKVFFKEAFRRDSKAIVSLLIDSGVDPNSAILGPSPFQTPLEAAIKENRPDMVELLLQKKADPNFIISYKADNCSYLFLAAINQNEKALEVFLRHPQNINLKISFSPLHVLWPLLHKKKWQLAQAFTNYFNGTNGSLSAPCLLTAIDVVIILGNTKMLGMLIAAGGLVGELQIKLAQVSRNEFLQKQIADAAAKVAQETETKVEQNPAVKKTTRHKLFDAVINEINAKALGLSAKVQSRRKPTGPT